MYFIKFRIIRFFGSYYSEYEAVIMLTTLLLMLNIVITMCYSFRQTKEQFLHKTTFEYILKFYVSRGSCSVASAFLAVFAIHLIAING